MADRKQVLEEELSQHDQSKDKLSVYADRLQVLINQEVKSQQEEEKFRRYKSRQNYLAI